MERIGRHLLYIAFFFPPSRASGVYRAIATANAFSNQGWRVTVLTADERFFQQEISTADNTLLDSVNDDVDVCRVPFTFQKAIKEDITKYQLFIDICGYMDEKIGVHTTSALIFQLLYCYYYLQYLHHHRYIFQHKMNFTV